MPQEKKEISITKAAKSNDAKKAITYICIFLGEFFATFMLMSLGCSAGSGFDYGLAAMVCLHVWILVSGAHMNPAVSLGAIIYGAIHPLTFLLYFLAQVLGALLGYCLYDDLYRCAGGVVACSPTLNPGLNDWHGLVIEFFLAGTIMLGYCSIWDPRNEDNRDTLSIRLGLIHGCVLAAGAHWTGGCYNPVKAFAPALYHNSWQDYHWIYWIGPIFGAPSAALFYRILFRREKDDTFDITTLD